MLVNSTAQLDTLFDNDGYLIFTNGSCARCESVQYTVARAAQSNNVSAKMVDCVSLDHFCDEKGIYNFPTVWIVANKAPSEFTSVTLQGLIADY